MSVRLNVRISKIMCRLIKVGIHTYATYADRLTLAGKCWLGIDLYLGTNDLIKDFASFFKIMAFEILFLFSLIFML